MTINTEPWALRDLFEHVLSNRADSAEIQALIDYLAEQKQRVEIEEKNKKANFERYLKRAFKLANRSTYGAVVMTEQDKEMIIQYAVLCDTLNSFPVEEVNGQVVVRQDAQSEYYQTMKQCDRIVSYFASKGLDAEKLLDEQKI